MLTIPWPQVNCAWQAQRFADLRLNPKKEVSLHARPATHRRKGENRINHQDTKAPRGTITAHTTEK
jgi:hypothetical protein